MIIQVGLFRSERVDAGEEDNCLVRNFFADREALECLERNVALHRAANCHNFRQEVSETMALVEVLDQVISETQVPQLHVVDLCCGSGLTSCALGVFSRAAASSAAVVRVTAVDRRPKPVMPHFQEAGLSHVDYLCADMLSPGFFDTLAALLQEVGLPVVLLGMHCCGVAWWHPAGVSA
eukprot:s2547_g4.t1